MFKRLSTQIYLTVLATLVVVVIAAGGLWRHGGGGQQFHQAIEIAGELLAGGLPGPGEPVETQRAAAIDLAKRLRLDLALYAADGEQIAQFGRPLPPPPRNRWRPGHDGGFIPGPGGPAWGVPLPDGRMIVARTPSRRPLPPPVRFVIFLGAVTLLVGLCAWPVVRGLTRRLERLQAGVERFGAGDLKARVTVKGRDEIAKLARSFNTSAERIESLVGAHRLLLANASHELRTPLARIRVGLELIEKMPSPERRAALERDIEDLDQMIEEILLLSRLDALEDLEEKSPVDLLALAAEEGARYPGTDIGGEPASVPGDPRLLRRLVRNLLENAAKHGMPPVSVTVRKLGGGVELTVADNGAGVEASHAEQVFEPFHRGPRRGRTAGSGLGLALVRSIAGRHGGTVRFAEDRDGRLNTVVVTLGS